MRKQSKAPLTEAEVKALTLKEKAKWLRRHGWTSSLQDVRRTSDEPKPFMRLIWFYGYAVIHDIKDAIASELSAQRLREQRKGAAK